ncbi:MAG TPA: hypothetical protein VMG10_34965 [Gemmataceae bacterium]|nr:hypothetical protein [Gemmataceae bacterium]
MPTISLTDLQQQIAQREQELQALREQLQAQQSHLAELTHRKESLQSELLQVDQEIAALATNHARATEQAASAAPLVPPSPAAVSHAEDQPQLGELIITMLRESTTPMTGRQLLEDAQRRGYQSKSHDPLKAMENRLQVLKSKGVIRRAKGQYGFTLASSTNGAKKKKSNTAKPEPTQSEKTPPKPVKSEPAAKKSSGKGASSTEAAKAAKPGRRGRQTPLRVVLTNLLKKSHQPLSGSELAKRALKAGYKTTSEKFVDSVWTMLAQMDNVEHLPQQGYRLKKR